MRVSSTILSVSLSTDVHFNLPIKANAITLLKFPRRGTRPTCSSFSLDRYLLRIVNFAEWRIFDVRLCVLRKELRVSRHVSYLERYTIIDSNVWIGRSVDRLSSRYDNPCYRCAIDREKSSSSMFRRDDSTTIGNTYFGFDRQRSIDATRRHSVCGRTLPIDLSGLIACPWLRDRDRSVYEESLTPFQR